MTERDTATSSNAEDAEDDNVKFFVRCLPVLATPTRRQENAPARRAAASALAR